jgi:hypothetical protein
MTDFGRSIVLSLAAVTAGCVGNDGGLPPLVDGGQGGRFDDPSDFDRSACTGDAPDSIDPIGIWFAEVIGADDQGNTALGFRIDAGLEGGLTGLLEGDAADEVGFRDGDLFLRRESVQDDVTLLFAVSLCAVDGQGRLRGQMAFCYADNPSCYQGEVTAYRMDRFDDVGAEGMTLLSEWRGPAEAPWPESEPTRIRVHGTTAYVLGRNDGLRAVDLADPASPAEPGPVLALQPGEDFDDVAVRESGGEVIAFVASSRRGVVIVDVTDPAALVEIGVVPVPPVEEVEGEEEEVGARSLALEGDRLYVSGLIFGGVQIFDVSDPRAPERIAGYIDPMRGGPSAVVVRGGVGYLDHGYGGFTAVDLNDPLTPRAIGAFERDSLDTRSLALAEAGDRLVALVIAGDFGSHLLVVDVTPGSATAFEEVASYETRPQVTAEEVIAFGDRAFVAYRQDGLRALDLAQPAAPAEVGHFSSWLGSGDEYGRSSYEGALSAAHEADRGLVLVGDTHRGLLVLALDPSSKALRAARQPRGRQSGSLDRALH